MSDWLETQRRNRAFKLAERHPVVEPGMFVQLDRWFGDVWAEILRGYRNGDDPVWWSVTFVRYEKGGGTRKLDSAYYGDIRRFCRREDISASQSIVYERDRYTRWYTGQVVWPTPIRDNQWGYERREDARHG